MTEWQRMTVELWPSDMTVREIAQRAGVCVSSVSKWASKHRDLCPARKTGPHVDYELYTRAAEMRVSGISRKRVAQMLHVCERTVSNANAWYMRRTVEA